MFGFVSKKKVRHEFSQAIGKLNETWFYLKKDEELTKEEKESCQVNIEQRIRTLEYLYRKIIPGEEL